MELLPTIIVGVVSLIIGCGLGYWYRRRTVDSKFESIEAQETKILKGAEEIRKQIEIKGKEEQLKLRQEIDEEARKSQLHLSQQEERLQKRQESLDKRIDSFDRRERNLNKRQSSMDNRDKELSKSESKYLAELAPQLKARLGYDNIMQLPKSKFDFNIFL